MNLYRKLGKTASVLFLALAMAGCGGGDDGPTPEDTAKALADARTAAMAAADEAKKQWRDARAALAAIVGMQAYNPVAHQKAQDALTDAEAAYEAAMEASEAAAATSDTAEAERQQEIAEAAQADAEAANMSAMGYVQAVQDVPAARRAAAAAMSAAKMAYEDAMAALATVEDQKTDGMDSYDAAMMKVEEAKTAYEAAMAAAAAANVATTSPGAKMAAADAADEQAKAEAALADVESLVAMVMQDHAAAEQLRMALGTAQGAAADAAMAAMQARDAAQATFDALADKKADDIPNYTRTMDQLYAAKAAYMAAKEASDEAAAQMATADGVAEAQRQQGIAEAEQANAEAANAEAMRFAGLVVATYDAAEKVRMELAEEARKLRAARAAAMAAKNAAKDAADGAAEFAETVAGLDASSPLVEKANTAAAAAKTAADAAAMASRNADEADTSAVAEAEQAKAEAEQAKAEAQLAEVERLAQAAGIHEASRDTVRIELARSAAEDAKDTAAMYAMQAREKATMARAQARAARADAKKAMRARMDYMKADMKADMAEAAASDAEAAATAAEAASAAAMQSYQDAMDASTVADAQAARDEAQRQQGIALANNTGDMGANAKYEAAKMAAADAKKYAGMHVLGLLQLLNGDDTGTAAAKTARLKAVNTKLSGNAQASPVTTGLATDDDNSDSAAVATVTWHYHGDAGVDTTFGTADDMKPGEGLIDIVLNTTPALNLTRDDENGVTAGTDETNFVKGIGLGDFAEYHITVGTGTEAKARAIVFTDKEQARAPIPASTLTFQNRVPDASRITDFGDGTAESGRYDHDGISATPPIMVTFTCPDGATCDVVESGNKVTSITGYRMSTGVAGATVAFAGEAEDTTYLAFGAWVAQQVNNAEPPTFGVFANGSGTTNEVTSVPAAITGTVTYNGSAAGVHNTPDGTNFFHADATLTAAFGNATAQGTITGRIHNIMSGGQSVSDSIYLDAPAADNQNIEAAGTFAAGRARMGAGVTNPQTGVVSYPYEGVWDGRFYNVAPAVPANQPPLSAAGTFGVQHRDMMGTPADASDDETSSFLGAFGAHR